MTKQYRIHIRGKQREPLDADLMIQLVVMLGRQLAQEAEDETARRKQHDGEESPSPDAATTPEPGA